MNSIGIAVCRSDISFFTSLCLPLYFILTINIFVIIIIIIVWDVDQLKPLSATMVLY